MGLLKIQTRVNATFDVRKILRQQRRQEFARLRRAGAFVRQTARQSIRSGSGTISAPGKPPRSQTRTLKSSIRFEVDAGLRLVRIGPAALGKAAGAGALRAIELGGWSHQIRRGRRGRRINIKPRPFMGPALEKESSKLPAIWQN